MLEGFCTVHQTDVPISPDRKCLADGSLALAPSTACCHQRLVDGAWTACTCKPIAAGTWRKILAQQAKVVEKRDRDRAAANKVSGRPVQRVRLAAFMETVPKSPNLATAHKPVRAHPSINVAFRPPRAQCVPRIPQIPCPICTTPFSPTSMGANRPRRQTCSATCGRIKSGHAHRRLERLPCSVCGRQFAPKSTGEGRPRKQFCSDACWRAGRVPALLRDERGRWARAS